MFKLVTLFGLFLVLAGISIVLRQVFDIDIPLGRVFFGVLLIWGGVAMLARSSGHPIPGPVGDDEAVFFANGTIEPGERKELTVAFSTGVVDLTQVPAANPPRRLEVNTLFGSTTILYDPSTPLRVTADSAFGQVALPDASTVSFGQRTWESEDFDPRQPGIDLHVASVFGNARLAARLPDRLDEPAVAGR